MKHNQEIAIITNEFVRQYVLRKPNIKDQIIDEQLMTIITAIYPAPVSVDFK